MFLLCFFHALLWDLFPAPWPTHVFLLANFPPLPVDPSSAGCADASSIRGAMT